MLASFLRRLRRARAEIVFLYDGRRVTVPKGKTTSRIARELCDILERESSPPCEIHVTAIGEVEFDKHVPTTTHQAIRNVVVSS